MLFVVEVPVIDEQPVTTVLEGRTSEMVCTATGRPSPSISWRPVSGDVDYVTGIQPVRDVALSHMKVFATHLIILFIMVALWNTADHYIFILSFVYGRPA